MDKKFLSSLNHDLSYRPGVIMEALENGVEFGSKEFFVYAQLRWYETDGKFGFCVAGEERLGEDVGLSRQEAEDALDRLKKKGLIEHVWCDRKVYRNKTKIWVSMVRLSGVCTNVDAIKVLSRGGKNVELLGKGAFQNAEGACENAEGACENAEGAFQNAPRSPVTTGVGNTNKILSKYADSSADADSSISPKEETSPFDEKTIIDVRKKSNGDSANVKSRRAFAIAGKVYKLMGLGAKPGVKMRNRIASRLDEGYTEDDIIGCIAWCEKDDYYKNSKDPMSWTSEDAMTKFKIEQQHNEEVSKKLNSKMEFNDTW